MKPHHTTVLKAMEIVVNQRVNWSEVGKKLVLQRPDVFLELVGKIFLTPEEKIRMAVEDYKCGKIAAIKLARNTMFDGLRDAKDYIDREFENHSFTNIENTYDELPDFLKE